MYLFLCQNLLTSKNIKAKKSFISRINMSHNITKTYYFEGFVFIETII